MPTSSEWRIEGECTRCAACCRHMRHPLMRGADGSTCEHLITRGGDPPTCTIRDGYERCHVFVDGMLEAFAYWESECKDFPQLSQDGEPLTDAGCRSLAKHLRDIGCAHEVVRRG